MKTPGRMLSIALTLTACALPGPPARGQQPPPARAADRRPEEAQLPFTQQQAIWLLRRVAADLKDAPDKYASARVLAQVAEVLWPFDEPAARALFRQAFDAARTPQQARLVEDAKAADDKAVQSSRQVGALREVLRLYGAKDGRGAEEWLVEVEKERSAKPQATDTSSMNSEVLAALALDQVSRNPEQALRLGTLSLAGREFPNTFGRLLFALNNKDRGLSNSLFRAALENLRRNGFPTGSALPALSNYLFNAQGGAYPDAAPAERNLLVRFFLDAAAAQVSLWRQTRPAEPPGLPYYYSFLTSRAVPILTRNAPDSLNVLQASLREMSDALSQEQRQQADALTSSMQTEAAMLEGQAGDADARVAEAEKERDAGARDMLLRGLALDLMRGDGEKALAVAGKIGDEALREQTEDDVRLASLQRRFSGPYEDARQLILMFHDAQLRARLLSELASRAARAKDYSQADALLAEASAVASKGDDTPDKVKALLLVARQYELFDPARGFETLSAAVKAVNQLKAEAAVPAAPEDKRTGLMVISYTVVNGKELTTGERLSAGELEFGEVGAFAARDYTQTVQIGDRIRDAVLRGRFLLAAAREVLKPSPKLKSN